MFFAISGFVITTSLMQQPAAGFGRMLRDFYARRCRRLVPALAVCAVASGLAAWLVDPIPVFSLHAGLAALVGVANVYLLMISADYFTPSSALNVFTQTWSLGVEEQFYLVYPALVWACGLGRHALGARRLAVASLVLSALSLALLFAMPGHAGGAAYFLVFGRFWELGLGCAAALLAVTAPGAARALARPWLAWLALAMVIGAMAVPVAENVLSSLLVVPPTALLILAGVPGRFPARILASPPFVAIGRISYSLYLWHWPVVSVSLLAFGHYKWQLSIMLVLGTASYLLVERPARQRLSLRPAGAAYRVALFSVLAAGAALLALSAWPNPAPLAERTFAEVPRALPRFDRDCTVDDGARPLRATTMDRCTVPPARPGLPTVWAMGDSHAGHLQGLLMALHEEAGYGIHLVETPSNAFPLQPGTQFPARDALFAATLPRLKPGDELLLARLLLTREGPIGPWPGIDAWLPEVAALADRMRPLGVRVVVMGPPPIYRFTSIYSCRPNHDGSTGCDIERATLAAAIDPIEASLRAMAEGHPNLFVFGTFAAICPPSERTCSPVSGGVPQYRDQDHFNAAGSSSPALALAFLRFLRGLPPG